MIQPLNHRATTSNLSKAFKLAASDLPNDDCTVLIAYDKRSHSWFASYVDSSLQQVGFCGRGHCPISAVEDLIDELKY